MWDWLRLKDLYPVIVPAIVSLYLGHLAILATRTESRRKFKATQDKETRIREEQEAKEEHEEDASQAAALTARFTALMDGYEARIKDVVEDNVALRSEVRDYKQRFESHQRVCQGCPNYSERMRRAPTR